MKDVIINVEEQIAENERRRRQRNEERRNRRPYDRNRGGRNAKAPYQRRENVRPAAENRTANSEAAKSEAPKAAE